MSMQADKKKILVDIELLMGQIRRWIPSGRQASLALTKLEEASMWLERATAFETVPEEKP